MNSGLTTLELWVIKEAVVKANGTGLVSNVEVSVGGIFDVVSFRYPDFDLLMLVYRCQLLGQPRAKEVADVRFVPRQELLARPVLPADIPLLTRLAADAHE